MGVQIHEETPEHGANEDDSTTPALGLQDFVHYRMYLIAHSHVISAMPVIWQAGKSPSRCRQ